MSSQNYLFMSMSITNGLLLNNNTTYLCILKLQIVPRICTTIGYDKSNKTLNQILLLLLKQ